MTGGLGSSSSPSCQIFLGGGGWGFPSWVAAGCSSERSSLLMRFLIRLATGLSGKGSAGSGGVEGDGRIGSKEALSESVSRRIERIVNYVKITIVFASLHGFNLVIHSRPRKRFVIRL